MTSRQFPNKPLPKVVPNQLPVPYLPPGDPSIAPEKHKTSKPELAKRKVKSVIKLQASDRDESIKAMPPQHVPHHSRHSMRLAGRARKRQDLMELEREPSVGELIPTHKRIKKNAKELEQEFQWAKKLQPYCKTAAWSTRYHQK